MAMLDYVTQAASRTLKGDSQGISWVWHHMMSSDDHVKFDLWLVKTEHPLMYEPGTPESRFQRLVGEMVAKERERREVANGS